MKKRLSGALLFAAAFQMMVGLAEAASCGNPLLDYGTLGGSTFEIIEQGTTRA